MNGRKDMRFTLTAAGIPVRVDCTYPQTAEFCRAYLTTQTPELSVVLTADDIAYERAKSTQTVSESYLETLALCRRLTETLTARDVLLFHSSAVAVDGRAYLFAAPSGTGKSTHTRLWRRLLGDRAVMINDDKPFLRFTENEILAFGSPWDGKHRLSSPISAPVAGICLLRRGEENRIERISAREGYLHLTRQTYLPRNPQALERAMTLIDRLTAECPLYRLHCNMDISAARLSYETMTGQQYKKKCGKKLNLFIL